MSSSIPAPSSGSHVALLCSTELLGDIVLTNVPHEKLSSINGSPATYGFVFSCPEWPLVPLDFRQNEDSLRPLASVVGQLDFQDLQLADDQALPTDLDAVSPRLLVRLAQRIAGLELIDRIMPSSHDDAPQVVGAILRRTGFSALDARDIVDCVTGGNGLGECLPCIAQVDEVNLRFDAGLPVPGWPDIATMVGREMTSLLHFYLTGEPCHETRPL